MARGRPSKKQQIVQAAAQLFSEQGYQGTSIDQVVAAAAVSKPTVYSNFPSKQVLWEEVLQAIWQQAQAIHISDEPNWFDAWAKFCAEWFGDVQRLAAYRVMLGEPYKMDETAQATFTQLKSHVAQQLNALLSRYDVSVSEHQEMLLIAVTHETWLMPQMALPQQAKGSALALAAFGVLCQQVLLRP